MFYVLIIFLLNTRILANHCSIMKASEEASREIHVAIQRLALSKAKAKAQAPSIVPKRRWIAL